MDGLYADLTPVLFAFIKDFEEILGDANGYNRRLEEALQVGGGFKHMAELWGRSPAFVEPV